MMAREVSAERGRKLFDTPARFMQPRLFLYLATFALVALGLVMVYSASSITSMLSRDTNYDAQFYLLRQAEFTAVGLVAAAVVAATDYHLWSRSLLIPIWIVSLVMLGLVFVPGIGVSINGASRWIGTDAHTIQPSEFAKVAVILTAANVASRYFEDASINGTKFLYLLGFGAGIPLGLIWNEPDKGTVIICCLTLLVMAFLLGVPFKPVLAVLVVVVPLVAIVVMMDDYSRARVMTFLNPWKDPYGDSYQLIQGLYAIGSGGLFGRGIGFSRQKYFYLPMAFNDFIYAIIGEELGLAGTLGVLCGFALFVWAGFQIARYAPDLSGRLIASGCTMLIFIQMLVNVCGVIGFIPLSGKPLPFISYGGSSIISCLILVGFIASVSRHSSLPDTVFDERRRDWSVTSDSFSLVGEATPRSARSATAEAHPISTAGFTVFEGTGPLKRTQHGTASRPGRVGDTSVEGIRAARAFNEAHAQSRVTTDASGRQRIDLGPSARDRLRSARGGGSHEGS
ncbi:MAG: putative lipid II flippase FtsW [Coriobacteriales bacterium]|nr:putative lipid II flippase FtsW [Coriobacteriales bacterium]